MAQSGPPLDEPVDIADLLHVSLDRNPDTSALVCAKMRLTWRELETVANRLATNLLALGLEPGARIATLMPNRTALLMFYLACFRAGLFVTPLNHRYTSVAIQHIQPGKPDQNEYVERFNCTYRDEALDRYVFSMFDQVRKATYWWMLEYNDDRLHESLGDRTPAEIRRQAAEDSIYALSI